MTPCMECGHPIHGGDDPTYTKATPDKPKSCKDCEPCRRKAREQATAAAE